MAREKRDQGRRRPMSFRWTTSGLSNERPGNEVMSHLRLSHDLNLSELFNWKWI
ncbi:hypothetical protein HanOQP8_Chr07g0241331 [Helianthus annuus]|nr:hypothetical protein HanLR1_Chr07g0233401 [Helianthus annuus]KAJ0730549.1 hypothetical protein HanOQP8_Chr07g0241331 [Helianthus annuus]